MSFANQFLSLLRLSKEGSKLTPMVHDISEKQDQDIARIKLSTQGFGIDKLSREQIEYASDYLAGT